MSCMNQSRWREHADGPVCRAEMSETCLEELLEQLQLLLILGLRFLMPNPTLGCGGSLEVNACILCVWSFLPERFASLPLESTSSAYVQGLRNQRETTIPKSQCLQPKPLSRNLPELSSMRPPTAVAPSAAPLPCRVCFPLDTQR